VGEESSSKCEWEGLRKGVKGQQGRYQPSGLGYLLQLCIPLIGHYHKM
jgi:hypothetical protein